MQRLLSVRITRTDAKFAYVVAFVLLGVVLARFLPVVGAVLADVIQLCAVWYGSRVFRAFGEPVAPVRYWWRMTAWRTASGWLAVFSMIGLLSLVLTVALQSFDVERFAWAGTPVETLSLTIFWSALAVLYCNSWARLRRLGIRKPPPLRPIGPDVLGKSKTLP